MTKLPYKVVSLAASVSGGLLAGVLFKRIWKLTTGDEDAPSATDADRGWPEILIAAAAQGAVFALVKAALDRGAAQAIRGLTGNWPGDEDQ
jgi:hypothetical protein